MCWSEEDYPKNFHLQEMSKKYLEGVLQVEKLCNDVNCESLYI